MKPESKRYLLYMVLSLKTYISNKKQEHCMWYQQTSVNILLIFSQKGK